MMRFKRLLVLLLVVVMVISVVACTTEQTEMGQGTEEGGAVTNEDTNNDGTVSQSITLKYANWNLGTEEENNIERQMIKAFMDKNPNIKIEIDSSIDPSKWDESLASAAAAGTLPDVFMINNVPSYLANEWLYDITEFTESDSKWANIPKTISDSIVYNGKTAAVPLQMLFLGYFINVDLFNQENVTPLEYGCSLEDFRNAAQKLTQINKNIVGLSSVDAIPDWYPSSVSENYGYYTWDGNKYNLNSKEFIDGINFANSLWTNGYVFGALKDDVKAKIGKDDFDAWTLGHTAIKWDGTWAVPGFTNDMNFKVSFIGVPGGRIPIVLDFLGIAKSSAHAKEAYEFAKWMSFSKEGYLKRVELAQASGQALTGLPIQDDPELVDKYFSIVSMDGVKEAYDNVSKGIVEGFKVIPGYVDSRWNAVTGIEIADKDNATIGDVISAAIQGKVKIEDYAQQLNDLANQKYQEAASALK
ncbi:extracellular solute-binding protein [Mahella sp.]|uniref:ABC transporter substrate-binding protein n=1 Tax=Mahella sp. TaxID=2798721 RepID=UPI0025BDA7B4|nr:extracellular solute-binding protein [Mahella sp.]MBZ4665294.1 hypothetical protein [Mahella sp.]